MGIAIDRPMGFDFVSFGWKECFENSNSKVISISRQNDVGHFRIIVNNNEEQEFTKHDIITTFDIMTI
jgi:hypothetical protein